MNWKNLFPEEQQEVVDRNHRADIKTPHCVVELQHSAISVDEIREREEFYGEMVWVFDCQKQYKNDQILFDTQNRYVQKGVFIWEVHWSHRKKPVLTCKKPVLLHLRQGLLLNIFNFGSYSFGLGTRIEKEVFFAEVNGRLNTLNSMIFPPDYVPTTKEGLEAQRLADEENHEPTEEEIEYMINNPMDEDEYIF